MAPGAHPPMPERSGRSEATLASAHAPYDDPPGNAKIERNGAPLADTACGTVRAWNAPRRNTGASGRN